MPLLTSADFDVANVLSNIGLAGAAILLVSITSFGWRRIIGFFGR